MASTWLSHLCWLLSLTNHQSVFYLMCLVVNDVANTQHSRSCFVSIGWKVYSALVQTPSLGLEPKLSSCFSFCLNQKVVRTYLQINVLVFTELAVNMIMCMTIILKIRVL